jgi:hypothetical protein
MAQPNVRTRVLQKAVDKANENLAKHAEMPLPDGLTPHKLRHTFASILVALGVDPGSVMDQLGHADPGFTHRVYRHGMRRDPDAKQRLRALVEGVEWAPMGTKKVFQNGGFGVGVLNLWGVSPRIGGGGGALKVRDH